MGKKKEPEKWIDKVKKQFRKKKKQIIGGTIAAAAAVGALTYAGYETWHYEQPKFHNLTIELGTESVGIRDFMTEYARPKKVDLVSDLAEINLNQVGTYSLTLRHGDQEQTVTLTVQDTTAPTADFTEKTTQRIDRELNAEHFVSNVQDLAETKVYFAEEPELPEDYADLMVTVVVEDASGNKTQKDCVISWQWMEESYTLELGDQLTMDQLLLDPEKDGALLDQARLDLINSSDIGQYEVTTTVGGHTNTSVITVQDTRGPELELQDVKRYLGRKVDLDDFIVSVSDASGEVELRLLTELDYKTEGKTLVVIEAEDIHGNITRKETTLVVSTDTVAPRLKGLDPLTVAKNSEPDLLSGVTATDKVDGTCPVTYDVGNLDLGKAGTYYITYRASDEAGNTTTGKRKIIVEHDAEDTAALVKSISDSLSDDPETIRNYVRNNIGYNHDWGGEDPVWYGFTNRVGNCYVHAMCLKAIFDLKGIESQLIWVTAKTHYWLIVKIDGQWKHIDATPGRTHSTYSLMNDAQRLATLSGRDWDRTLWPACE